MRDMLERNPEFLAKTMKKKNPGVNKLQFMKLVKQVAELTERVNKLEKSKTVAKPKKKEEIKNNSEV